ncbi:MAG: EAL domain-containing protein [Methyloprofundus sp.]|nr:EAL domain-containing protein [Methyloprofundus sp.]
MNDSNLKNQDDQCYLKSLTILYVEDEVEVREQLTAYLTRRCGKIYTAEDGKQGLTAYKRYKPNIVITDILMPVMDGLKMAEYIQSIAPDTPIIIVTAFEEPRYFHQAIDLGVQQYVNKPVKMPILEQALLKSARILRAEAALKEIEERYRILFPLSQIAISVADATHPQAIVVEQEEDRLFFKGNLIDCNEAFLKLLGYQDLHMLQELSHNICSLMTDSSAALLNKVVQEELLVRGFSSEFEIELVSYQKSTIPVMVQLILRYSDAGEPIEIWGVMRDVREQRKSEQDLRLSAKVFESSKDAIIISDKNNIMISVNQAFSEITGYTREEVVGKNPKLLQSGRHDKEFYQKMWIELQAKGYWQGEIWNRRKSGEIFPEWISISLVYDNAGNISHHIANFSDITDLKSSEAHIEFLANYDPLTELPNRRLFIDRLDQAIKKAAREDTSLAVIFFDLDHFKTINDSLGHSIGDLMLIEVAQRISACVRKSDTIARLSGDEFAAVIADVGDISNIIHVAKKIIDSMRVSFKIENYELHITTSIGISLYPSDGDNYELLLKNADTAMYCAKNNGRDNFEFFSHSMSVRALERLSLEGKLRYAIKNNELKVFYQPQIQVSSGKIIGMEALLRWPHPEIGMISPADFIPLTEETGLIIPIGEWILEQACRQNKAWQDQGLMTIPVSVNLSGVQFRQRNLLNTVQGVLDKSGLEPRYLELELTESILMDCSEFNVTLLKEFRQLGVQLSIDDFGTGYSSLSYLKRFPIGKLKIDQSFSMRIPEDKNSSLIVSAIISLGHDLEMVVIAEGVENEAQFNFMKQHQCDEIQGYYFSKAVSAKEMEVLLQQEVINPTSVLKG